MNSKKVVYKIITNKMMSLTIAVIIGVSLNFMLRPSIIQAGNLEWRAQKHPLLNQDGQTLLTGDADQVGCLVQLIWVGPNGVIDPAKSDGSLGGDDQLVVDTSVDRGREAGENPIHLGYGAGPGSRGKFYVSDITYNLSPGEKVFTRVFNASKIEDATHYADSSPYVLTGQVGESWDCTEDQTLITKTSF